MRIVSVSASLLAPAVRRLTPLVVGSSAAVALVVENAHGSTPVERASPARDTRADDLA
jgi:hypothetical protein